MFALYYVHPETGRRYACTSGHSLSFVPVDRVDDPTVSGPCAIGPDGVPEERPALFTQRKNVEKVLRDHARAIRCRLDDGDTLDNLHAECWDPETRNLEKLPGSADPDLACFLIAPMVVSPDLGAARRFDVTTGKTAG